MNFAKKLLRVIFIGSVLTLLCVVCASAENIGVGTVTADALRLRSEASPSGEIVATATQGDLVLILEEIDNDWYRVDYKTIEGYMSREFLTVTPSIQTDLGYGKVHTNGSVLNVRSGPSSECDQVGALSYGSIVSISGLDNGWFEISTDSMSGYVSSDYIVSCKDASGRRGDSDVSPSIPLGEQVVDLALNYLGCPYVWGGNGPKCFDCSGFTKYIYSSFGVTLNRTASSQLSNGRSVSRSELQPGDLVFFDNGRVSTPVSHVGIYIGEGRFVHASTNSYRVEISSLQGHYAKTYECARRIF